MPPLKHSGLTWLPYDAFRRLRSNGHYPNPYHLNMSPYGVDADFWIWLPPTDEGLSKQLLTFGFREPFNCSCYVKFVTPNDSVLDIGSNIGLFALLGSRARKVVCVEPLGNLIGILRENIKQNGLMDKYEVLQKAVGPKGKLHLEVNPQMNLSKIVDAPNEHTIDVESVPLGDLIREHPSNLLRMDVEGFEYDILKDQIPEQVNKISMELHTGLLGHEKVDQLMDYFIEEGFKLRYFIEDLPLRLYPFLSVQKFPDAFKFISYVRENISIEDARELVYKGRSLKYFYLQRGNGIKTH